jgi:hypothetical protein
LRDLEILGERTESQALTKDTNILFYCKKPCKEGKEN